MYRRMFRFAFFVCKSVFIADEKLLLKRAGSASGSPCLELTLPGAQCCETGFMPLLISVPTHQ